MVKLRKKHKIMVLEFLSEADASLAFKINDTVGLLNKIKEHPLFDKFEINRYALSPRTQKFYAK